MITTGFHRLEGTARKMAATMALTLSGDIHAASHARSLTDLLLSRLGVTGQSRADLSLMVSEACTNAVSHARQPGNIEVHISVGHDECVIDVGNSDGSFDDAQLHADLPDASAEGGRGLPIITALADAVRTVHERSGWVVLRMVKRIVRKPDQT
ncbi:ATP-binding protein [Micromonospora sp. NBC_01796]|uniref:ATP-binding protein n=1 Tax=Micromonospora sp. NBC_01796 TaxID=2975987 RepID=UPI002DD82288|nr:ATP-binding protein [Micromonospora sp. NBC_01796]WSA85168.1 ATP-binding protein [Micromonospora sp. NBC_01796]